MYKAEETHVNVAACLQAQMARYWNLSVFWDKPLTLGKHVQQTCCVVCCWPVYTFYFPPYWVATGAPTLTYAGILQWHIQAAGALPVPYAPRQPIFRQSCVILGKCSSFPVFVYVFFSRFAESYSHP